MSDKTNVNGNTASNGNGLNGNNRNGTTGKIIIESVTEDGRTFRPSDWIERISSTTSAFGYDRRVRYSRYVQPQILQGRKCLVIDPALREQNPSIFNYLMDFARGNRLRVHLPEAAAAH